MQNVFMGNEQMTVDQKGRVGIPRRFLAVLHALAPDAKEQVGVMMTPERSIKIMPAPVFEKEIEQWSRLNDRVDAERMVLNMSASMADLLPLDAQNRIKLNPMMAEMCSIDRQVVFVGSLNYMQLFDVGVWRQMYEQGLSQWSSASNQVARKEAGEAPVNQYVINAPGAGPAGSGR